MAPLDECAKAPLWRNIATRKETCNARNKITNGSIIGGSGCTVRAFAVINAPIAVAQPDLACSGGEAAFDGSCVPPEDMNNANVALGLPQGTVNDVVPSLNQGGYVDQGGGGGIGGIGGGGGGHGR